MKRPEHTFLRQILSNGFIARRRRLGAIMPLFAFAFPVLLIVCAMAINIAYMRLTRTELQIATDATAKAAGRAMSIHQTTEAAIQFAQSTAELNSIGGHALVLEDNDEDIQFGEVNREDGDEYGRMLFSHIPLQQVNDGEQAPSVRINGRITVPLLFRYLPTFGEFNPASISTVTQVDRDIALILDRSGSMAYFKDEEALEDAIDDLYYDGTISYSEYYWASRSLYDRYYYWDVRSNLPDEMWDYAYDMNTYNYGSGRSAPRNSRMDQLYDAVQAFIDVLEDTDQEELISVSSFSTYSSLDLDLEGNYDEVMDTIRDLEPYGGTSIGVGMQEGIPTLLIANGARPFSSKTIVVLTDGVNNTSPWPDDVARDDVPDYVTIHTVTFSDGADETAMEEVAEIGGGEHYHADTGDELIEIFEEIANNLPTIITD